MIIEVITKEDKTIVQIGFEDNIRIDMQEKIKTLYRVQSPVKNFSLYYPFDIDLLEEWEAVLNWKEVSSNKHIKWSVELINKFSDKWDWGMLWLNMSVLCWDAELLEKYQDKLAWDLIVNTSIDWIIELHEKFEKYLTWSNFKYDYDMIKEHTTNNRNRFLNNPNLNFSNTLNELYLYAKSIDEDKGVLILFDSINLYFNNKL
ncbi:MAG: hypothetical protein LBV71_06415 [Prevotella sp.]|jgi:hypothetical protein|nr:hypothetical protein [Prevotella sp.]